MGPLVFFPPQIRRARHFGFCGGISGARVTGVKSCGKRRKRAVRTGADDRTRRSAPKEDGVNRTIIAASSVLAAAILAACGGGGGGSTPPITPGTPNPTATPTIAPLATHVEFAWSGAGHSIAASNLTRSPRDVTAGEPIVVAAAAGLAGTDPTVAYGQSTVVLTVTEKDVSGNVVSTQPSKVTPSNGSVVSIQTPSPATSAQPMIVSGGVSGATTITATFADGAAGTIPADAYQPLHLTCPSHNGPEPSDEPSGVAVSGGTLVAQTDPSTSDVWLTGPACAGGFTDSNPYTLHFRLGFQTLDSTKSFASYLDASGFTSGGTTLPLSTYFLPKAYNTYGAMYAKVTNGDLKLRVTGIQAPLRPLDANVAAVDALFAISNPSGVFTF